MEYLHADITKIILQGFYTVCNGLPFGLDKTIYRNALATELTSLSLQVETEKQFPILFKNTEVGKLITDIVVNSLVIIKVTCFETAIDKKQNLLQTISFY